MKKLLTFILFIASPAFAGDLTTGHPFTVNETVTHTTLNSAVDDAEINAGAVGTAEIADSAVTVPKLQGIKSVTGGRLTLVTGNPIPGNDVTAASTLFYTPHLHNEIALFDGAKWLLKTFTERSIAIPSSANTNYDVFLYNNAGTITLELMAWSNSGMALTAATNASPIVVTANGHGMANGDEVYINGVLGNTAANGTWIVSSVSTNTFTLTGSTGNGAYASGGWLNARDVLLTRQDGVYVKSGAPTRRYLGSIRTTTVSGQCEDSTSRRFVANYYNRHRRILSCVDDTDNWSYTAATWREVRAQATLGVSRFAVIIPAGGYAIDVTAVNFVANSTGATVAAGVGLDSSSVDSAQVNGSTAATMTTQTSAEYSGDLPIGYHVISRLEISQVSGTTNWYGDLALPYWQSGMTGEVDL